MENKIKQSCIECGVDVLVTKYEKAKLCEACGFEKRAMVTELKKIPMELQARPLRDIEEEGSFEDIAFDPDEGVMHRSRPSSAIGVKSSLGTL
jgi:hypothetical protein